MSKHDSPALIGLVGPAGSGKDTVAGLLADCYGFAQVAFADPLRDFTAAVDTGWGLLVEQFGYEDAKRKFPSVRERLIDVGQAARHHIDEQVWVLAAARRVNDLRDAGFPVVLSDVRQRNEADWVLINGGSLVAIDRPGCAADQLPDVAALMLECDHGIDNSGNLAALRFEVYRLVLTLALECDAA